MATVIVVSSIVAALSLGVVSPGPSFVFVARLSVASSRRDGLAAALGMGLGGVVFASLALIGLTQLFARVTWLYLGLKLLGGLYLLHLAFRLWRGAAEPLAVEAGEGGRARGAAASFALGLATQLSNPKAAVIYASVFAALLPQAVSPWAVAVLPPTIFVLEAGWYAIVALAFSAGRPRAAYLRAKRWIDRLAGAVMGVLGLGLVTEAMRAG